MLKNNYDTIAPAKSTASLVRLDGARSGETFGRARDGQLTLIWLVLGNFNPAEGRVVGQLIGIKI